MIKNDLLIDSCFSGGIDSKETKQIPVKENRAVGIYPFVIIDDSENNKIKKK
ncbi:hypothetical protein [Clostridium massiliamazoniense]|uniref:hypothetical protein n=1 Tax=Clostridium massiliamazoniense TaxID=1347366 RepID=UPI000AF739EF|nr:hypothetical protein [Clostridium massiliamazoniense]